MTPTPALIYVGFVDEFGIVHELRLTPDTAPAARARGWMVLDELTCPTPAHVRTRPDATGHSDPDDEDDGA